MKYLLTILILIIVAAGIRAQEMSGNTDDDGKVITAEKETAKGAGPNTTYLKKHQGEFKVSEIILKRERQTEKPLICVDDDTCGDNGNSCHTSSFLWGALSVIAGLLAFTGIRK